MHTTSDTDAVTYLFSSMRKPPQGHYLHGYAFVGSDYIYGQEGASARAEETGELVSSGHDGCYMVCNSQGPETWTFGTDGAGFKRIFYYHDGKHFVVSDSFARTIDEMRDLGIPVLPDYVQLSAMNRVSPLSQMATPSTLARGVRLLPVGAVLTISASAALETFPSPFSQPASYVEELGRVVQTWVARFATLLSDPRARLELELTGGRDSRAVFALFLAAKDAVGENCSDKITFRSHALKGDTTDMEIAEDLTKAEELELNGQFDIPRRTLSGSQKFERWRAISLGSYHPIYFPGSHPDPWLVGFTGGGAGNQRTVYEHNFGSSDPEVMVSRLSRRLAHEFLRGEFAHSLRNSLSGVIPTPAWGTDWLREHYRQFRGRLHAGRAPMQGPKFAPLGSESVDRARIAGGLSVIVGAQLNYDIIASCAARLLSVDFDDPDKNVTPAVRGKITQVTSELYNSPGRCWFGDPAEATCISDARGGDLAPESHITRLAQSYSMAREDDFVSNFWSGSVFEQADLALASLKERGRFGHAPEALPLSRVLSAHLVSPTYRTEP